MIAIVQKNTHKKIDKVYTDAKNKRNLQSLCKCTLNFMQGVKNPSNEKKFLLASFNQKFKFT